MVVLKKDADFMHELDFIGKISKKDTFGTNNDRIITSIYKDGLFWTENLQNVSIKILQLKNDFVILFFFSAKDSIDII